MTSIFNKVFTGIKNYLSPPNSNDNNPVQRRGTSFDEGRFRPTQHQRYGLKRRANFNPEYLEMTDDEDDVQVTFDSRIGNQLCLPGPRKIPKVSVDSCPTRGIFSSKINNQKGSTEVKKKDYLLDRLTVNSEQFRKQNGLQHTTRSRRVSEQTGAGEIVNKFARTSHIPIVASTSRFGNGYAQLLSGRRAIKPTSNAMISQAKREAEKFEYQMLVEKYQNTGPPQSSRQFTCFRNMSKRLTSGRSTPLNSATDFNKSNLCALTLIPQEPKRSQNFALKKSTETHEDLRRAFMSFDNSLSDDEESPFPPRYSTPEQSTTTKTANCNRKGTPIPNRENTDARRLYSVALPNPGLRFSHDQSVTNNNINGKTLSLLAAISNSNTSSSADSFHARGQRSSQSTRSLLSSRSSSNDIVETYASLVPRKSEVDKFSTSSNSSDEDIKILSESILSHHGSRRRSSINSLELETNQSFISKKKWLQESGTRYREDQKRREDCIREEEKTLHILKSESDLSAELEKKIRNNLTLTDIIVLEESEPEFPEITEEMEIHIKRALSYGNDSEVLATAFNIDITRGDLKTLAPCKWLNDNVINTYMDMIAERSRKDTSLPKVHVFTTFFYPKFLKEGYSNVLKRWTRKVDIFSFDLLFFPIHLGIHWCLAAVDFRSKTIRYYDSLLGKSRTCVDALLRYLSFEMKERKKLELNAAEWSLELMKDIPTQENGSDCGVFTCKFAEYLSRNSELTFKQANMNYFRDRMIYEIMKQNLLYP